MFECGTVENYKSNLGSRGGKTDRFVSSNLTEGLVWTVENSNLGFESGQTIFDQSSMVSTDLLFLLLLLENSLWRLSDHSRHFIMQVLPCITS